MVSRSGSRFEQALRDNEALEAEVAALRDERTTLLQTAEEYAVTLKFAIDGEAAAEAKLAEETQRAASAELRANAAV